MAERIVVAYRATLSSLSAKLIERAKRILDQARSLSGGVIAWSATSFALDFPPDSIEQVIELARTPEVLDEGETAFACAIAQGEIASLSEATSLSWGIALVAACGLAEVTEPGEITVSDALKAYRQGELLTLGTITSRTTGIRVRGAKLDVSAPWRRDAAARVSRVRSPASIVGVEAPSQLVWPGSLSVLRADPGLGGTRFLQEIARAQAPARALFVSPSGSGLEPFGALRRAVMRSDDVNPFLLELSPAVERLTTGQGVTLEEAARIVAAFLWPKATSEQPGPLLVDDAADIDEASLLACVRAHASAERSFPFVIRLDATRGAPRAFAELAPGPEADLSPLPIDVARELASGALDGALTPSAKSRWAKLGGGSPLAIVEALCHGIASGDLVWRDENAEPRRRASGRGKSRPARQWITLRAMDMSASARSLLALLAMLGGEAHVGLIERVLLRGDFGVSSPRMTLEELGHARFLYEVRDGYVSLFSRTHREALAEIIDEPQKKAFHRAICDVLEAEDGKLGFAEAAHHAARAGDSSRAARLAMIASRVASELGLEAASVKLASFAQEQDPSVREEARARVASSIPARKSDKPASEISSPVARLLVATPSVRHEEPMMMSPISSSAMVMPESESPFGVISANIPDSSGPYTEPDPEGLDVIVPQPALERESLVPAHSELPPSSRSPADSEPPTIAREDLAPLAPLPSQNDLPLPASELPESSEAVVSHLTTPDKDKLIAERLTELAKEALLGADTLALERWVDGLGATGEHAMLADRMRAMARLSRGEIGDALRVLKRARASLPKDATGLLCQTSLALGMALAVAGRSEEALLEGLDALSRARQSSDARGTSACLAFLAKLYASVERADDAARLRLSAPPPAPPEA